MEKSSQIAWKLVPLRHFFPLKVVPLIEVLLYGMAGTTCVHKCLWHTKLFYGKCSEIVEYGMADFPS
jgi:hypothetical protein